MGEVLVRYDAVIASTDGRSFVPSACGREIDDGRRWEGWVEFHAAEGDETIATPQETVQPNREAIIYWATGLTAAYLEGALTRALTPPARPRVPSGPERSVFDEPAPRNAPAPVQPAPRALLDPFEVHLQGEDVLRRELVALDTMHLRNIALAYHLADAESVRRPELGRSELADLIVTRVRDRLSGAEDGA